MASVEHDHVMAEKDLKIEKLRETIASMRSELGKTKADGEDEEDKEDEAKTDEDDVKDATAAAADVEAANKDATAGSDSDAGVNEATADASGGAKDAEDATASAADAADGTAGEEAPPCPPGAECEEQKDKPVAEEGAKTKEVMDGEGEKRMVVVETGNAELADGLKGDAPEYRVPEAVAKLGSGVKAGRVTVAEQDVQTQTTQ